MKQLIIILGIALLLSTTVCAQNETKNTNVFVRVYDLQGKKLGQGRIESISDTSLQLYRNGASINFQVNSIGTIKTKRSPGYNILVGALTGAATVNVLDLAFGNGGSPTVGPGQTALILGFLGGIPGAAIGGIKSLVENKKSYEINGDLEKWKAFNLLENLDTYYRTPNTFI